MTRDLTSGSPLRLIWGFTVPLLLGHLFQQFYNLVDALIVGRLLGEESFAGVGATGAVNFLIIGFCMGVCSGCAIPIAQRFGARDYSGMRRYVANDVWLGAVLAVILTVVTTLQCRNILILMRTPADILDAAYDYIVVIFWGIPVIFLYNMVAGIMRAVGDSRTPVLFLVGASFLNIGLDLLFIGKIGTGVEGAAWATVISQTAAGVGSLLYLRKKFDILHIEPQEWAPNVRRIKNLCAMGLPMGLQYSITAIGSVVLQTATNSLGSDAVAAVTAGTRVNHFLACPYEAIGATMATYGGQNVGAGKLERLDKGLFCGAALGFGYALCAFGLSLVGGEMLAKLFLPEAGAEIITNAGVYLKVTTAFYVLLTLVNTVRFMIQGIGYPGLAIFAGVLEMVGRTLVGFILVPTYGFLGVCLGSPIAWLFADMFLVPAYFFSKRRLRTQFARSHSRDSVQ